MLSWDIRLMSCRAAGDDHWVISRATSARRKPGGSSSGFPVALSASLALSGPSRAKTASKMAFLLLKWA
jgi:hypothetical protein